MLQCMQLDIVPEYCRCCVNVLMCWWRCHELWCVVGILLHVLYFYVEMWALGASYPVGFV